MEQRFPFLHSLQDISLERGKSRSFLIFLALSFFFWMITKFSNQYTEVLTFDVSFKNFPVGVIPISDSISEVQITLSTSGFQMLFYKFFVNKIVLKPDKGVFKDGIASIPLGQSIKDIQNQLIGVTEVNDQTVEVTAVTEVKDQTVEVTAVENRTVKQYNDVETLGVLKRLQRQISLY